MLQHQLIKSTFQEEAPEITFSVISDLHIGAQKDIYSTHLENALIDLNEANPNAAALCIVGDITESGKDDQYNHVKSILNTVQNQPIHMVLGNHDVRWQSGGYLEASERFKEQIGLSEVYYDQWIGGYHFIFLSTSDDLKDAATLSQEQLEWLKHQLKATSDTDPVFIFLHQSLVETSAGSYEVDGYNQSYPDGVVEDEALRSILEQHPKVLFFTGHTHIVVDHPKTVYEINGVHYINTGSVGYTLASEGYGVDNGSQGLCVEVYKDKIVIKGRDFVKKMWCQRWEI